MLTKEQAADIRNRHQMVRDWLTANKTNSYKREELESTLGITIPTNDETSACEVFEFIDDPPVRYFLYINEAEKKATTWTGERLGAVYFGREFRDNFGGRRVPITVLAINGKTYHGTYYKSAGDYARVKMAEYTKEQIVSKLDRVMDYLKTQQSFGWYNAQCAIAIIDKAQSSVILDQK